MTATLRERAFPVDLVLPVQELRGEGGADDRDNHDRAAQVIDIEMDLGIDHR